MLKVNGQKSKVNKGFSLVEAMLSVALFSLIVTVSVEAIIYGQESSALSGARSRAVYLAEEGVESLRNLRDADFANLTNGTYGISSTSGEWELVASPDVTDSFFTRTIQIADGGTNAKQATVNVGWQQNLQRTGNISLITHLTNWQAVRNLLNCDWSGGIYMSDSFNSVGNTGNALKVQANGRYVYMIYNDAGSVTYDFVIVDAGVAPATILGTLNLAGSPTNIAISGDYAYVSSDNDASELQIINISNPSSPALSGSYNAPGTADANGVFAIGTTAYLARSGSSDAEFFIINASDPSSPSLTGSVDIGGNGNGGNEVYVSGNYAYIASPDDSAEMKLVDISSPSSPVYLSANSLNLSGSTDALSITGFGKNIFLSNATGTVYIFNITNPLSTTQTSTYAGNDQVNDVALDEKNGALFLATNSNTNEELEAVNISTLGSPSFYSGFRWIFPFNGVAFAGDSCTVYAVGGSNATNPELLIIKPGTDVVAPVDITNLATSSPTANSINLAWTAPGDDGSIGMATTYDIRYSTSAITEGNWSSATQVSGEPTPQIIGSAETMTVSGLSADTTYYFAIKTSDEVPNTSGLSNVPNAKTLDVTAPANIINLATSSPTANSINLAWTAPGDDGNAGTATTFDIRYSTATITEGNWASATQVVSEPTPLVAGTNQVMTVFGLSGDTIYYFAIKTSDEVPNTSTISNIPNARTLDNVAPAIIVNLATSTPTVNSINLAWTAPGDSGNVGTATSYDIRYSTATITEGNWASATQATGEPTPQIAGTNQSMTVSGLSADTTYYFAMKTSDEVPNISTISNVPNGKTLDTVAPANITNLALSAATGKSILLTWTAPGDNANVGTATTYDIRYSTATITAANWGAATQVTGEPAPLVAGTVQTMRVSGLNWRTTYFFAIRASDEVPNLATISNVPSLITRTQASYLTINTATARSNAPTDNTQVINITIQNTATDPAETITIDRMSTTWQANNARRLNTIRINGVNYWTGSSAKGVLNTLSPAFTLSSSTTYPITYLDFSTNSIGVNTNSVSFTMSDTSTITSATYNITQ